MASCLGWLVLIGMGFLSYQLGLYFGGGNQELNLWPIIIFFVLVEAVAFVASFNARSKTR